MMDAKSKNPHEIWKENCELLAEEQEKYASISNKSTATAIKKLEKIIELQKLLPELEKSKDTIILSETAKSHLTMIYGLEKYAKWSVSSGKGNAPATNGFDCELKSIQLINKLDGKSYIKNESVLKNTYLKGIPDILEIDSDGEIIFVADVKSSWNMRSFFKPLKNDLLNQYWWQAQGYMFITNTPMAEISYCLVSPPEELIQNQKQIYIERNEDWEINDLEGKFNFDDIPEIDRRIRFVVERDEEAINKIPNKILACRNYLSEIESFHENRR